MRSPIPDLSVRAVDPELMDAPTCDSDKLLKTLDQFETINRWLTPSIPIFKGFLKSMLDNREQQWQVLDVGAGGCDMAIWLARQASLHQLRVHISSLDLDDRIVEYAKRKCSAFANIEVIQHDATQLESLDRRWHFAFSNHLLHHLNSRQIVQILEGVDKVTTSEFVISDLRRSYISYLGYSVFAALFLRGSFAYHDGRLSIRKGFRVNELSQLIADAGLQTRVQVKRYLPGHFAIVRRPTT